MADAYVDVGKAIEVVRDRLYYVVARSTPVDRADVHFFTGDDILHYWPFFLDFGPLSLGNLYRFSQIVNAKLGDKAYAAKRLVLYSGPHMHRRANAVYLLAAYTLLFMGRTPEEAYRPFAVVSPALAPWHDASPGVDTFRLSILDTLRGIARARECGFFSFEAFDIEEYEHYEKVENGDMNWIVGGRFLAFAGPHDTRVAAAEGYHTTAVDDVLPYFRARGVAAVVRLNKKYYNERRFTTAGIDHHDMYYLDGSNPPEPILQRFLATVEGTSGAVAVHCKAGLGRTGTCIGAYIMKHYRFTAREVIGWMRVCRPGSVIGPQQQFLEEIQPRMWEEGDAFRRIKRLPPPVAGTLLAAMQAAATATPKSVSTTASGAASVGGVLDALSALSIGGGGGGGGGSGAGAAFSPAPTAIRTSPGGSTPPAAAAASSSARTSAAAAAAVAVATASGASVLGGRRSGATTPSGGGGGGSGFGLRIAPDTAKLLSSSSRTLMAGEEHDGGVERDTPLSVDERSGRTSSGYASPGSSPISAGLLRARARGGTGGDRDMLDLAAGSGAGTPPGGSLRYLPVTAGMPVSMPSPSRGGTRIAAAVAVPLSPPLRASAAASAAEEYSQGDALRSAKSRSPMMTAAAAAASASPSTGLRFAGSGVVATTPKSPGGFYATGGSMTPVAIGSAAVASSPSRFSLRR